MSDSIWSDWKLNAHYTNTARNNTVHSLKMSYFIFFLAASFYLYEFILQVAPSVMAEAMMKTFGVTGEGFGFISGRVEEPPKVFVPS